MEDVNLIEELYENLLPTETKALIIDLIPKIQNKEPEAINNLSDVLGTIPKRPLYYIAHHITELPEFGSRSIMRYCGDYIDQIIRFTLEDKLFYAKWFRTPLGRNVGRLKKFIEPELHEQLVNFNIVYTQAKHDFNHTEDVSLFNVTDVVRFIYITKKLAFTLLPLSTKAQDYDNQGETAYEYNPLED